MRLRRYDDGLASPPSRMRFPPYESRPVVIVFADGKSGRDAECRPQRERIVADAVHFERGAGVVAIGDQDTRTVAEWLARRFGKNAVAERCAVPAAAHGRDDYDDRRGVFLACGRGYQSTKKPIVT